ncbi:hypothetical protein NFIA_040050 [Paecilomyces variotii No. 5]|uniref:Uncharacterized protein n=1 Tax=Byssochlamys spectabilis (strain No. 5 / NBRC 109023) TaxID=1356009 RepID=V5FR30_BYSSN|nr:hypothetical protein NFIA_040050 [Paecilomyces variotii No. 5]
MSGSSTPGAKPEKTMSSRLLTMKFMQRAAHSAANNAAASPSEDGRTTPKRARLSTDAAESSPATPSSDLDAISAAIKAEEQKRAEAVARQAAEAGETEWVLDFPGAESPVSAYPQADIVSADSWDVQDEVSGGRRCYGNFKRKKKSAYDAVDIDSDDDFAVTDPSDPAQIQAMMERAQAKAAKKTNAQRKFDPDKVRLRDLTSISGSRETPRSRPDSDKKKKKRKSR